MMDTLERAAETSPKTKSRKRKLFDLHAWLGFNLALLLPLVLITGTFSVVSDEIDWLIQADMRVVPDEDGKVSWGTLEAAARDAARPEDTLTALSSGEGDHFAYRARFERPDGRVYFVLLDPWRGHVTSAINALTVQRFLRDLHRYLFMPSFLGLPIVTSLAFALLTSMYTGLKTTGPLLRTALRLRTGRGPRIFIGDAHKAAGVWSIWFITLMAVTGIWYLAEFGAMVGGAKFEPERPGVRTERVETYGDVMRPLHTDDIIKRARAAFPGWEPTEILYPTTPQEAITVLGRGRDVLVRPRANRVFLDPVSGDVIKVQRSGEIGWIAYLNEVADPLHFGVFGGLTTKFIWFSFGLLLTGLAVTGLWLAYRRLARLTIAPLQMASLPILSGILIFGAFYIERYVGGRSQSAIYANQVGQLGDFSISLEHRQSASRGKISIRVHIHHPKGYPLLSTVTIKSADGTLYPLKQRGLSQTAIFQGGLPDHTSIASTPILLTAEFASGVTWQGHIQIPSP